tara:strand:- start:199 stop:378 length:180 start_codon:yes stop_codon:yes gene_type:complete
VNEYGLCPLLSKQLLPTDEGLCADFANNFGGEFAGSLPGTDIGAAVAAEAAQVAAAAQK